MDISQLLQIDPLFGLLLIVGTYFYISIKDKLEKDGFVKKQYLDRYVTKDYMLETMDKVVKEHVSDEKLELVIKPIESSLHDLLSEVKNLSLEVAELSHKLSVFKVR